MTFKNNSWIRIDEAKIVKNSDFEAEPFDKSKPISGSADDFIEIKPLGPKEWGTEWTFGSKKTDIPFISGLLKKVNEMEADIQKLKDENKQMREIIATLNKIIEKDGDI